MRVEKITNSYNTSFKEVYIEKKQATDKQQLLMALLKESLEFPRYNDGGSISDRYKAKGLDIVLVPERSGSISLCGTTSKEDSTYSDRIGIARYRKLEDFSVAQMEDFLKKYSIDNNSLLAFVLVVLLSAIGLGQVLGDSDKAEEVVPSGNSDTVSALAEMPSDKIPSDTAFVIIA